MYLLTTRQKSGVLVECRIKSLLNRSHDGLLGFVILHQCCPKTSMIRDASGQWSCYSCISSAVTTRVTLIILLVVLSRGPHLPIVSSTSRALDGGSTSNATCHGILIHNMLALQRYCHGLLQGRAKTEYHLHSSIACRIGRIKSSLVLATVISGKCPSVRDVQLVKTRKSERRNRLDDIGTDTP